MIHKNVTVDLIKKYTGRDPHGKPMFDPIVPFGMPEGDGETFTTVDCRWEEVDKTTYMADGTKVEVQVEVSFNPGDIPELPQRSVIEKDNYQYEVIKAYYIQGFKEPRAYMVLLNGKEPVDG